MKSAVKVESMNYDEIPLNMDTKLQVQEKKGSFCIDALLRRDRDERDRAPSPVDTTSRSVSPTSSTRSRSPPISPGSEEIPPSHFVPRPGLLGHVYPSNGGFYGYPAHQQPPHHPQQSSAFHSLENGMKMQFQNHSYNQLQQMHIEFLATRMWPMGRLPDLAGKKY